MKQRLRYSISNYIIGFCVLLLTNEASAQSSYDIYVFDVNTIATLKIEGNAKNIIVAITNINGQILWQNSYADQSQINLPTEKLAAGVYIVSIRSDSGNKTMSW